MQPPKALQGVRFGISHLTWRTAPSPMQVCSAFVATPGPCVCLTRTPPSNAPARAPRAACSLLEHARLLPIACVPTGVRPVLQSRSLSPSRGSSASGRRPAGRRRPALPSSAAACRLLGCDSSGQGSSQSRNHSTGALLPTQRAAEGAAALASAPIIPSSVHLVVPISHEPPFCASLYLAPPLLL